MKRAPSVPDPRRLVISETPSSSWHYHLRYVEPLHVKLGGNAGTALCGKRLGWDVTQPLESYGIRGHMMSSYCLKCAQLAHDEKMNGHELLKV